MFARRRALWRPVTRTASTADGALTRTTSRLGAVRLYVVVAAWSVVVAPATPEEPGDQEHPQEDPYVLVSAYYYRCYHRQDNDSRRHPEHRRPCEMQIGPAIVVGLHVW